MTKLPPDHVSMHIHRRDLTEEDRQTDRVWRRCWWVVNSAIIALSITAFVVGGREERQPPNLTASIKHEAMPGSTVLSWTAAAPTR